MMRGIWQELRRKWQQWQEKSPEYRQERCRRCGTCRHVCSLLEEQPTPTNNDAKALED